jgi:CRISPR-associated protein Csd2
MLGCAPAQVLFEDIVKVEKNTSVPRSFADYNVTVDESCLPTGVELLKLPSDFSKLT